MPPFGPIKRRNLIRYFRKAGWTGPFKGTRHDYMLKGTRKQRIPNEHHEDISQALLAEILRQAGISREEWEQL